MSPRSSAARIATAPSSGAVNVAKSPWNAPIGVRAAETMTTGSGFIFSLQGWPMASAPAPVARAALGARFGEQFATDQHAPDLTGARADLIELGVAPQATGRVLVNVTVATQDLDRLARHPGGALRTIE